MIDIIKAIFYSLFHYEMVHITVVRRYKDAQANFIGELYLGEGRQAKMIGMTCDSLPFDVGAANVPLRKYRLEFKHDFLAPMAPLGLRVGGVEPSTHGSVCNLIALRRYCPIKVVVLNRFIEHVLEKENV